MAPAATTVPAVRQRRPSPYPPPMTVDEACERIAAVTRRISTLGTSSTGAGARSR
jgi:hypothetical protein